MDKVEFTVVLAAIVLTSLVWVPVVTQVAHTRFEEGYKVGYAEGKAGLSHQFKQDEPKP